MRFISTLRSNFEDRSHRWVFVKPRENNPEQEADIRTKAVDRLDSPISFGVADIRKLDQYQRLEGPLTAEQKAKLNHLVEFHLSLVASDFDARMPSRTLFELRYSNLWQHVRLSTANRVEALTSRHRAKLKPLEDKDISNFSHEEMQDFMRYYQYFDMQARRAKLSKEEQAFSDVISQKLVSHAHNLLQDFKIEGDKIIPKTGVGYLQTMQTRDKLFIMQAYRMFSNRYDWAPAHSGGEPTADQLKDFSKVVVTEMADKLSSEDPVKKIEYLPLWEIIEDLTENESRSFQALEPVQKTKLMQFARQARSAHLLNWVKGWQRSGKALLLPEHIKSLRDVAGREGVPEEERLEFSNVFGASDDDMREVLEEFSHENGNIHIERKKPDGGVELVDALEAIKEEEEKINDEVRFKAFEGARKEFLANTGFIAIKQGIAAEGNQNNTFGTQELTGLENYLNNEVSATAAMTGEDDSPTWTDELKNYLTGFEESIRLQLEAPGFKDNKPLQSFYELTRGFAKQPYGEVFDRKEQEANKVISGYRAKVFSHNEQIRNYRELAINFSQSKKEAKSSIEVYREGLKGRITSRRLAAADMAVLFDEGAKGDIGFEGDAFVIKLNQFRDSFRQLIPGILNDVQTGLNNIGVSDNDRMSLWFDVLDKALGQKSLTEKITATEGELSTTFKELREDRSGEVAVSGKALIEAAITHYREDIYEHVLDNVRQRDRIAGIVGQESLANEKILSDYLSHYDRMHNHLYETDGKQATVESGQKSYIRTKKEDLALVDGVRKEVVSRFGDHNRESIRGQIEQFSIPGQDLEAVMDEIDNRVVYWELLKTPAAQLASTKFYEELSSVIPEELKGKVIGEVAKSYLKWKAKEENSRAVDDLGECVMAGKNEAPGRRVLNEMKLRAIEFEGDFEVVHSEFKDNLSFWLRRLNSGEEIEHAEMASFFAQLQNETVLKLISVSRNLKSALEEEFPQFSNDFIKTYIQGIENSIKHLAAAVKAVDENCAGTTWGKDSTNQLKVISEAFLDIKQTFSLGNGDFREMEDAIKSSFDTVPDTVQYLNDVLGLFEPGGKEKAEAKFDELREKYRPVIRAYAVKNEEVKKRLRRDIKLLKPKEFLERHEMSKQQALLMIDDIDDSVKNFTEGWKPYNETGYFKEFLRKYENPDTQVEALMSFQEWPLLEQQTKAMTGSNQANTKWIKRYDDEKLFLGTNLLHPTKWALPHIKYSFSLLDLFYRMPKKLFEVFERREERRRERAVANIGMSLFGNSAMGKEFQRISWEEEEKRVKEFETQYEKQNFHEQEKALYKLRNPKDKDEARALINLLVNDGYMRWDKPELWRTLENLQRPKKVKWNIPDDLHDKSLDEIMEMIQEACGHIWTPKIFIDWDGSLEGNHKKQMESNYKNFDRMCNKAGSLDHYFSTAIDGWRNGDTSINPAEFEGFLHRAFEFAKYNSVGGDNRWFYLILGMTVKNHRGETLISHEAKDRFNKTHLKAMPFLDFFVDNQCWKKDGMPVPEGTPGAHEGGWTHDDIQAWGAFMLSQVGGNLSNPGNNFLASRKFMAHYMMNSPTARLRSDRFGRSAGDAQDHDDAWIHGMGGSYEYFVQSLNRSSAGTDTISPDFAAQIPQAYEIFMEETVSYIHKMDKELAGVPGWQEKRRMKLEEAGQMMRKMFMVINTIAGNYHGNDRTSPQTIDTKYWRGENAHTEVIENREKINKGMKSLLNISGKTASDNIWTFTGTVDVGSNYDDRKADDTYKAVSQEIGDILNDEEFFANANNVERMLEQNFGL